MGNRGCSIAHNARFDRRSCERAWPGFAGKHWACSQANLTADNCASPAFAALLLRGQHVTAAEWVTQRVRHDSVLDWPKAISSDQANFNGGQEPYGGKKSMPSAPQGFERTLAPPNTPVRQDVREHRH